MARTKIIALAGAGATAMMVQAGTALAQDGYQIPPITVYTQQQGKGDADGAGATTRVGSTTLPSSQIVKRRASTSDTAALLQDVLGVNLYTAGGVSSLPTIHGLADDRLRTKVDGMDIIASCPNHMNPALSYIDPTSVGEVKVWTGVAPVSVSGDAIGGAISVKSARPKFAGEVAAKDGKTDGGTLISGNVGAFYRSNGNAFGGNLNTTLASDSLSLTYSGAYAAAGNYKAGGPFKNGNYDTLTSTITAVLPDDEVGSSAYKTTNHAIDLAWKNDNHLLDLKLGYQKVPEQLYPNQRMDMLDNTAYSGNLGYEGKFKWGKLDLRAYHQYVDHFMDFGEDKLYIYGWVPALPTATVPGPFQTNGMPMYTKSHITGASAKADIDLTESDALRVGAEAQFYRLDDWWPPSPDCGPGNCQGGMAPYTFWNIRDGERDRLAAFSEWEAKWNDRWTSLLGVRYERVAMDAGDPAGYNTFMYNAALFAGAFNKRTDNNLDLSALVRYEPSQNLTIEFGAAQKTRSPGLYELYPWSVHPMALEMNNFVGDGNGYLGNPDLKPEIARTISLNAGWKSDDGDVAFTIAPYYSRVEDYIDVVRRPTSGTDNNATGTTQFVKLQYANQKARLYGIDLYAKVPLAKTGIGDFGLSGMLNYTNGKNLDTGDGLYNIMPLNAKVALSHKLNGWDNSLELVMVDDKKDVSAVRNELTLPSYMLVNLRGGYAFNDRWRMDFGVENLFDKNYYMPLGGAYVGEGATMSFNKEGGTVAYNPARTGASGTGTGWGTGVPGPGRSFYLTTSYSF